MKFLYNPFRYIAGIKALLIGWCCMLFSGLFAFFVHSRYNGLLDYHFLPSNVPISPISILDTFITWLLLAIVLGVFALVASKSKFRWIDVLGTTALAKFPLLLEPIIGVSFGIHKNTFSEAALEGLLKTGYNAEIMAQMPAIVGSGLLMLLCLVWYIILLYNAFIVSSNIKKPVSVIIFIIALILVEVLSVFLLSKY